MSTHLQVKHPGQIKESATRGLNDVVVIRHLPVFTLVLPFLVMAELQVLSSYSSSRRTNPQLWTNTVHIRGEMKLKVIHKVSINSETSLEVCQRALSIRWLLQEPPKPL